MKAFIFAAVNGQKQLRERESNRTKCVLFFEIPEKRRWSCSKSSLHCQFGLPISSVLRWPTLISVAQRSAHCRHSAL